MRNATHQKLQERVIFQKMSHPVRSLLDWLGRETRSDKRGAIPANLAPISNSLGLQEEEQLDAVWNVGTLFTAILDRCHTVCEYAARMDRQWIHGVRNCDSKIG